MGTPSEIQRRRVKGRHIKRMWGCENCRTWKRISSDEQHRGRARSRRAFSAPHQGPPRPAEGYRGEHFRGRSSSPKAPSHSSEARRQNQNLTNCRATRGRERGDTCRARSHPWQGSHREGHSTSVYRVLTRLSLHKKMLSHSPGDAACLELNPCSP